MPENGAGTDGSSSRVTPDDDAVAQVGAETAAVTSPGSDGGNGGASLIWVLIGIGALAAVSGLAAWKLRSRGDPASS